MADVAVMAHSGREEAERLAAEAVAWLTAHGHRAVLDAAEVGTDTTLAISLGGDGTMLRTVENVCRFGTPVLGVNVGHLGYLTEVDPDGMQGALDRFFAGDYEVEERMTLEVAVEQAEAPVRHLVALNEVVVEKTVSGHTARLAVTIDEAFFTTYACDALIVATPTGSTAYNLSARGPIVSPRLDAVLLTPVSAHMLFDRSLVLHPAEAVRLEVLGPAAAVVADGRPIAILGAGDAVTSRAGARRARLVTFGRRDFHRILKTKFGLADR